MVQHLEIKSRCSEISRKYSSEINYLYEVKSVSEWSETLPGRGGGAHILPTSCLREENTTYAHLLVYDISILGGIYSYHFI